MRLKKGPFFAYQNAISLHFADFASTGFPELKKEFFKQVKADFERVDGAISPNNPWIHQEIELSLEELLKNINTEEQLNNVLKKLPTEQKQELMKAPKSKKYKRKSFWIMWLAANKKKRKICSKP